MSKKHKQKSCHQSHKHSCKEKCSRKKQCCCHSDCHHQKKSCNHHCSSCHHDHMCWGFLFPICCHCQRESSHHRNHTSSCCDCRIDNHCESSSFDSSSCESSRHKHDCESSSESRNYHCYIESCDHESGNTHNHWLEACWNSCCNCIEIRIFHIK